MSFTPDEIEMMKEIVANLEKCAAVIKQQIVVKNGMVAGLQKCAAVNIYKAFCFHLTVSGKPVKQLNDTLRRLYWSRPEVAKRTEAQYYTLVKDVAKISQATSTASTAQLFNKISALHAATEKLAEDFRVCIEMARRDVTPEKLTEIEQKTAPAKIINIGNFKGVLGDIQAENVQTGDYSSIHKQPVTAEKKKGIIKKILKIIGAIVVAVIAAIVVDFFADFGWLQSIKAFIDKII